MELKNQINKAIAQHGMWKSRLMKAIESGTNEFNIDVVKTDNNCEFGKWLYNTLPAELKNQANYEKVRQFHADFHKETARILSLISNGNMQDAKLAMGFTADYSTISANLTLELMEWKKTV